MDEDLDSYELEDNYSYSEETDETPNQLSQDRLPLVPTDFTSIEEALQNFTAVFESRFAALKHTINLNIQIWRPYSTFSNGVFTQCVGRSVW